MMLITIILFAVTTVALTMLEFKKMVWTSRIFLIAQYAAIIIMVLSWLGISF